MQKVGLYRVLLITGILFILGSIALNRLFGYSLPQLAEQAGHRISEKAAQSQPALSAMMQHDPWSRPELIRLFEKQKTGLYLFRHDSLVYWNNAQIPLEAGPETFPNASGFIKLRHGYYLYVKLVQQASAGLALCLVKPSFDLQNNYLKNNFAAWTGIPGEVGIDTNRVSGNDVYLGGTRLFSLAGSELQYAPEWAANTWLGLFLSGFLLIVLAVLLRIKKGVSHLELLFTLLGIVLLRGLMLYFEWPGFLYRSVLYNVHVFGNAQSLLNPYLGDIVWNALVMAVIAIALHFHLRPAGANAIRVLKVLLLLLLAFITLHSFNEAVLSLVTNSTLNFDFLSIFTIRPPAFAGLLALAVYALALYVLINKLILFFNNTAYAGLKLAVGVFCICLVQYLAAPEQSLYEASWLMAFAAAQYLLHCLGMSRASLGLGFQILLVALITSVLLNRYIDKKQKQNLGILSLALSERHDAILENEFSGLPAKISSDEKLSVLMEFLPAGKKEVEQLLRQKYFGEYFNRYNIDLSLFDESCNPLLAPKQAILLNEGFFEDQIRYNSDSTFVPGLFFIKNYKNNSQYVGKITVKDKNLYVLMEPKQFEELGSFPDLLLDQSQQKQEELKNFSYAVYRAAQNTSRYGNFNYPFFLPDSAALAKSGPGFIHYYFENDDAVQIISQRTKNLADKFTYNSYVFLFFSVLSYCAYFLYTAIFTNRLQNPSLTRRIQTIIIVLLLLLMSAVGITSGKLVSRQFETDNKKQLQEKTQIIINELAAQFKADDFFEEGQREIVNLKLNEYAHLFNTVISLFDKDGHLFNTSQPRLYELGLAAQRVNPGAFYNLRQNRSSAENVIETAGTLNYFSLYTPLYNAKHQLLGFVNLPYFARQSDLANELSGIISALINVYVILFVISILAGLILSGYITQPLRLIKQQIANISLGRQNEKIEWNSSDEIGRLVAEYNQMLVKLEHSAGLLAKSERESAWREMAKQVAHEIKNPLTPMKLNLQYLQHLMKNNPQDFKEKFEKASAGIIEQIDSLAAIANEFSHFAKLPATSLQPVNLVEIISSAVVMLENQKGIALSNTILEKELLVMGDKDQCLRVFNNILKNAVQALDGVLQPHIEISSWRSDGKVTVKINDNGCGIAEELKPKIFSPNFTTKSTGSGLGLAMVKNILQGFGGRIWFESGKEEGTAFYLEFISARQDAIG